MAVSRVPGSNTILVTGMTTFQTPEAQAPAVAFPAGYVALDVANARSFIVVPNAASLNQWRVLSPEKIPDLKWGNGTATSGGATQRIFDPEFADRAATTLAGGITPANFETVPKNLAQYACRIEGIRFTRSGAGAPGGLTNLQLFVNGVAIGVAATLLAGTFSGSQLFTAVNINAGDRISCQALVNTATVQNLLVEALVLPPAG